MNRRELLKAMGLGVLAGPAILTEVSPSAAAPNQAIASTGGPLPATVTITWNATAGDIQAALAALRDIKPEDVQVIDKVHVGNGWWLTPQDAARLKE